MVTHFACSGAVLDFSTCARHIEAVVFFPLKGFFSVSVPLRFVFFFSSVFCSLLHFSRPTCLCVPRSSTGECV